MSNVTGPDTALDRDRIFERLVDQYQESVLRMCYYCLNDKSQAEDAAQETFLKGWFRFMNRSVTPEMLPGEAVTEEEKHDAELAEAVKKLPFKLREVILLYYYQGMNVNEIADALNISHSSVSGRLKRGKEKLKNMLEGRELDE